MPASAELEAITRAAGVRHTDNVGSEAFNLGEARCAVREYLVSQGATGDDIVRLAEDLACPWNQMIRRKGASRTGGLS